MPPPSLALGRLLFLMNFQHLDRHGVERDWALATARLGWAEPEPMADVDELLANDHRAPVEVNVLPSQSQHLASPEAGEGDKVEQRVQPMIGDVVEEPGELLRRPDCGVGPCTGGQLDMECGVPGDQAPLHRGVQRGPERRVDSADRGRRPGRTWPPEPRPLTRWSRRTHTGRTSRRASGRTCSRWRAGTSS
jgi:hypothetical protein